MRRFGVMGALVAWIAVCVALPTTIRADDIDDEELPPPPPIQRPAPPPPAPAPVAPEPPPPVPVADSCPGLFPDFVDPEWDGRFEGFHKPIVQPYLFEDPFITTGIYPVYIYHEFPKRSVFRGGEAHVVALQARAAITCRLGFFAPKDGRMWHRPDLDLLDDSEGWMDISAGLKYALVVDREAGYIITPSVRFEIPIGSTDVYSGNGDGTVIPAISAAWAPGNGDLHLIGDLGLQIPFDSEEQSHSFFYHLYADYTVAPFFTPFVQISGVHWWNSGNGKLPVELKHGGKLRLDTVQNVLNTGRFEGADVLNLGSRGVDGQDYVTWAVGAHIPLHEHVTLSFAYERPVFRKSITKQRVTTSVTLEF